MSWDQNAGQSHNIKTNNSSSEMVEEVKYLGTTLKNWNSIQADMKSRLKSGNACYHLVQNLLYSSLLSKNIKTKIHRTIIFPVVLYGCETWLLTLREERRMRCLRTGCWGEYLGLRGMRCKGSGENYIMRSFMIHTPHQILFEWPNWEQWDGQGRQQVWDRRGEYTGGETWVKETTWKTQA